jgi:hypothetical protein
MKFVKSANGAVVHGSIPPFLAFPFDVVDIRGPSVYGGVGLEVRSDESGSRKDSELVCSWVKPLG